MCAKVIIKKVFPEQGLGKSLPGGHEVVSVFKENNYLKTEYWVARYENSRRCNFILIYNPIDAVIEG